MDSGYETVGLLVIAVACLLINSRNALIWIGLPAMGAAAYWLLNTENIPDGRSRASAARLASTPNPRKQAPNDDVTKTNSSKKPPSTLPTSANPRKGNGKAKPANDEKEDAPEKKEEPSSDKLLTSKNPRKHSDSNAPAEGSTTHAKKDAEPRPRNSINIPAYTPDGMMQRRDEFIFRGTSEFQSLTSRTRTLDSMYQELLDTSVRRDPNLRRPDESADDCEPLRGLTQPHLM